MKTFHLLSLAAVLLFASCEKEYSHSYLRNQFGDEFSALYPTATLVEWDNEYSYSEAEFYLDGIQGTAYFSLSAPNGTSAWMRTEWDIHYNMLPEAVKTAFQAGDYASWRVDDVDKIDRPSLPSVYVIEVEKGGLELYLYYNQEGIKLSGL